MITITKQKTIDGIREFIFKADYECHNTLISFLAQFKFSSDQLLEIDTPLVELEDEYLFLHNETMKVHIFISSKNVHLVIDSSINQDDLDVSMSKYFSFNNMN